MARSAQPDSGEGSISTLRSSTFVTTLNESYTAFLGEHWMEGISFLYFHCKDSDPEIMAHIEQIGLVGGEHDYRGEGYFIYSPR